MTYTSNVSLRENGKLEVSPPDIPSSVEITQSDLNEYRYDKGKSFPCDKCTFNGIAGVYQEEPLQGMKYYCDCQYGKQKHLNHQRHVESVFDYCGIPDRLKGVTLETAKREFSPTTINSDPFKRVVSFSKNFAVECPVTNKTREGLTLLGKNGVGKSGLLVIVAREYWKMGLTPIYIKYIDLIKEIQDGYSHRNKHGVKMSYLRIRNTSKANVLIIDDLGDPFERSYDGHNSEYIYEQETRDRCQILFNVIAERHENKLPTLFSGNYSSFEAISKQFNPRISSRIKEMTAIINIRNRNLRS